MQHAQAVPLSQVIAHAKIKVIASQANLAAQECLIDTVSQILGSITSPILTGLARSCLQIVHRDAMVVQGICPAHGSIGQALLMERQETGRKAYMHMDLQAVISEPRHVDMCGQSPVNVWILAHEVLVVPQDAIQLVKILHEDLH